MLCATTAVARRPAAALPGRRAACLRARALACPRRSSLALRAYKSDKAEEARAAADTTDFAKLASEFTGQLASEFADRSSLDKLSKWLVGSHSEEEHERDLPPRTDQTTEESDTKKLLRNAAEMWGVPTTMSGAMDAAKHWLSGPSTAEQSERGDTQMVARVLHRLMDTYERHHGEEFEGRDEGQYDRLYSVARTVLGSSLSKQVLTRLVRAYLNI